MVSFRDAGRIYSDDVNSNLGFARVDEYRTLRFLAVAILPHFVSEEGLRREMLFSRAVFLSADRGSAHAL